MTDWLWEGTEEYNQLQLQAYIQEYEKQMLNDYIREVLEEVINLELIETQEEEAYETTCDCHGETFWFDREGVSHCVGLR